MYITKASLRAPGSSGAGALAAFLAEATTQIGQGHHLVWSCFDIQGDRPFLYRMTGSTPRRRIDTTCGTWRPSSTRCTTT
jgi:hypothetical protein